MFIFIFVILLSFVFLNILYSNCVVIICFGNLIIVRVYLSYFIVLCFYFITLSFGGLKADKRFLPARSTTRHVPRNLAHQGPADADWYTRFLTAATKA